tara:strand:+ start:234 stop:407 length:174 start_codon:yes stop_codon:yes gene_type:complete
MGSNRGQNDISYAMYEELEGRLRVDPLYNYNRLSLLKITLLFCQVFISNHLIFVDHL